MALSPTLYHPSARRPMSFSPLLPSLQSNEDNVPRLSRSNASRKRHKKIISDPSIVLGLVDSGRNSASWTRTRAGTSTKEYINNHIPRKSDPRNIISSGTDEMTLIELTLRPTFEHRRESAFLNLSDVVNAVSTPSSCSKELGMPLRSPPSIPPKSRKRISTLGSAMPVVALLNYTSQEWKKNLDTLKALFSKRYFKKCTTKCQQLLLAAQTQSNTHPLYLIHINFYLSLCLDQNALVLPRSSSSKAALLKESLFHLQVAKDLIPATTLTQKPLPSLPNTAFANSLSPTSSKHSSTDSLFSQLTTSTTPSSTASPTHSNTIHRHTRKASILSWPHHQRNDSSTPSLMRPAPLKLQKRVSFAEPSRPVSLQIEDWDLINSFPLPPSPTRCPSLTSSISEDSDEEEGSLIVNTNSRQKNELQGQRLQNFYLGVREFERQLDWHISSALFQLDRLAHDSLSPSFLRLTSGNVMNDGQSYLDRVKARRQNGWGERKRFDPKRYQDLCEKALEDLYAI